ncbi:MAG: DUF3955 domain-containing protein [Ruminococcus sp.]|nr:DUF3955 domain-containing protein [Ruminococcus sp.]
MSNTARTPITAKGILLRSFVLLFFTELCLFIGFISVYV